MVSQTSIQKKHDADQQFQNWVRKTVQENSEIIRIYINLMKSSN